MKRNKHISTFLGGFATALALTACLTTALAASGKVSYNFANVALDGTQKITAGQDITAANGQKIPGSILYTDEAGGKTNYLPIRTISELLGVEIGYDSATKTVLLGKQPAAAPEAQPAGGGQVLDFDTPETVPENPRRGDVELIKSRGGTLLPDDDVNSYRGSDKLYMNKDGLPWREFMVGNKDALDDRDKKKVEEHLVNGDYPKNKKGETYGPLELCYYVGYEPDLVPSEGGYVRWKEYNEAPKALDGLSKEECPHEYTYYVYDLDGNVIKEGKATCQGHFEGKSREYVQQAMEEGRLW